MESLKRNNQAVLYIQYFGLHPTDVFSASVAYLYIADKQTQEQWCVCSTDLWWSQISWGLPSAWIELVMVSLGELIKRREWCAKQKDFVLMLRAIADKLSLFFLKQTSALWTVSPMMWTRPSTSVMMRGTCWTAHALARAGGDGNVILLVSHQLFPLAKHNLWLCRGWLWYGETGVWIWAQSLPTFCPELHNCKSRSNAGFGGG